MSINLLARTGRHRQRYDEHFRLVAGCIPYRLKQSVENLGGDLSNRLEVLMISSPDRHDLVFPKGGWENDESVGEAACREALEEAGVKGIINETILGVWEFRSKSRQNSCTLEGACRGYMFAMEVTEELEWWPEQSSHKRRWVLSDHANANEVVVVQPAAVPEVAVTTPQCTSELETDAPAARWCDADEFNACAWNGGAGYFEEGYVHSPLFGPMPTVDEAAPSDGFQLGGGGAYYY
ncbi:hypothetical protein J5N97_021480 [Dioscorea zingiberensis]|uniref:Nudix hydrolase domain-containing protein n=1 Tax=Dioscorea zingiberensis TaxID=325984 RepID=A0A9D5CHN2_9LILI|nr:hypothetical protein J5N97_021480 [Dioscorea zingiberensis]